MSLHVESEVVRPGKGPVALLALEGSVARVFSVVARQLVRACELPAAALPVAVVWLLPCGGKTHAPVRTRHKKKMIKRKTGREGKKKPLLSVLQRLQRNSPRPEFQQGSVSTCSAAPAPTPHIHQPPSSSPQLQAPNLQWPFQEVI